MSDILLIIPAYNEEANIEKVVENLKSEHSNFHYIIINDGSSDRTKEICEANKYNIINLEKNIGLAGAFKTGMRYAYENNYKYAVQFDGDGQHEAKYVPEMKKEMDRGYDIVIASRFIKQAKKVSLRMFGSSIISFVIYLKTKVRIKDPTSGMRMYNEQLIKEFAFNFNYAPEPDTIAYLIKNGAKVSEIPATMKEREGGVSYLTPYNAIKYMYRILISIIFMRNFRKN